MFIGIQERKLIESNKNKHSETIPRSRWPDRSDPWSDEFRAHTCSRCARITWSGKGFERTLSGQWSGTCLIRGHFVLGRSDQRSLWSGTVWSETVSSAHKSDQRPIRAHTSLTRDQFERHFFKFFLFSYWLLLSRVRDNNKTAFWSELHLKIWWVDQNQGVQLITTAGSLKKRFWFKVDQAVFMQSCLSSFFQLKA